MTHDEPLAARKRQFAEDAEEQQEWERRAYAEYERRRDSLFAEGSGEGDGDE